MSEAMTHWFCGRCEVMHTVSEQCPRAIRRGLTVAERAEERKAYVKALEDVAEAVRDCGLYLPDAVRQVLAKLEVKP